MGMAKQQIKGGCLCGSIRYSATPDNMDMGLCHCNMCRKWTGGVYMMVACGSSVKVENDADLGVYQSSKWGQRCFCKKCGTSLFWRTNDGTFCGVGAGSLDDQSPYKLAHQVFIDEKPDTYTLADTTHNMTGAEVFAMFADGEDSNNG